MSTKALTFPTWMYGPYRQVRSEVRRRLASLRKGQTWQEVVGDSWLDVREHPGLIVLGRAWSSVSPKEPQFHADQLWAVAAETQVAPDGRSLSLEMGCRQAWSFVGVIASHQAVVPDVHDQLALLQGARMHWRLLQSVGPRYSSGHMTGAGLEGFGSAISHCLTRQGAKLEPGVPLTWQGLERAASNLPGLRIHALLTEGDVDGACAILRAHEGSPFALAEHFFAHDLGDVVRACVAGMKRPDPDGLIRYWLKTKKGPKGKVG